MNRLDVMTKDQRKSQDANFAARMQPRLLWASTEDGTAMRTPKGYRARPAVQKRKAQLTEAQDNAIGRAARRRTNRHAKGWKPYGRR